MCGIFGIIGDSPLAPRDLAVLARHAEQRGRDSSGLIFSNRDRLYSIKRGNIPVSDLLAGANLSQAHIAMGHSRLVTNGLDDNQPIVRDGACVLHNGIIVNEARAWESIESVPSLSIDTEVIAAVANRYIESGTTPSELAGKVLSHLEGVVACALMIPRLGKLILFSNNGSLYLGQKHNSHYFASESFALKDLGCDQITQVFEAGICLDIPIGNFEEQLEAVNRSENLIPSLGFNVSEEKSLLYEKHTLKRCTKCILPETMPYISFDEEGVCNYCHNYTSRNNPKPLSELKELIEPYRRQGEAECIVPFSGGRDSCYALHLIREELGLKAITYTYDWGMVTDLGRRNISRMSSALRVENIIVAANISQKRRNIRKNFSAWLKSPHLGMVSILTAGDKHFFRHVETVKRQTGVSLNLWGVNPLEVTHFKAGFLGVPPDFAEERVYNSSAMKQLQYQGLRLRAMAQSRGYFNASIWDTLSGEYYRSFHRKSDYFHIFDYVRWDEDEIDHTLRDRYDWETAEDTSTTWRIGDGTAAIYNYIYYTLAGFTEHDTFRSNQIREGDLDRETALKLVEEENQPRYPNIKWYLDAVQMDFAPVINAINAAPKVF